MRIWLRWRRNTGAALGRVIATPVPRTAAWRWGRRNIEASRCRTIRRRWRPPATMTSPEVVPPTAEHSDRWDRQRRALAPIRNDCADLRQHRFAVLLLADVVAVVREPDERGPFVWRHVSGDQRMSVGTEGEYKRPPHAEVSQLVSEPGDVLVDQGWVGFQVP